MDYQGGTGIGTVVRGAAGVNDNGDEGTARDHLHPGTDAGQALLAAGIAFLLLFVVLHRPGRNAVQRIGDVAGAVILVGAAEVVFNWAVRMYALRHPAAPMAAGLALDV